MKEPLVRYRLMCVDCIPVTSCQENSDMSGILPREAAWTARDKSGEPSMCLTRHKYHHQTFLHHARPMYLPHAVDVKLQSYDLLIWKTAY